MASSRGVVTEYSVTTPRLLRPYGCASGTHDVMNLNPSVRLLRVIVPLVSWPIVTLSVILIILSALLALSVLLHKGRGGGMSDLFGGGMSTAMGGVSTAERRLDRITFVLTLIWVLTVIGLLVLYRIGV